MPRVGWKPQFDLDAFKRTFFGGKKSLTERARGDARELKLDESDIDAVVQELRRANFFRWYEPFVDWHPRQDAYKVNYKGYRLFVKIQIDRNEAVVVSFHKDERR